MSPALSVTFTLAPLFIRNREILSLRLNIDQCNGFFPSLSGIFKKALFFTRSFVISSEPRIDHWKEKRKIVIDIKNLYSIHNLLKSLISPFSTAECSGVSRLKLM